MGEAAQAPGRPPSARRRLVRVTALLAGATLLTGLLQAVQATGSQAATGSGSRTATLALNALSPRVPAEGGSVTVTGTVTNAGKSTITDARVGVRIAPEGPLGTRSAMKTATTRTGYSNALDGDEIAGHTVDVPNLRAGLSASFTLRVPVGALGLDTTGVYQLGVTLNGQTAPEPYDHVLGIKRTFLPWYADGESAKPLKIGYIWPLTDRPHLAPRGDTDSQQSPIFLDDDLAKELAPGGRLQEMVQLAKQLPVTWAIDPDLLASVDAMTKGYRVAGPGGDVGTTVPGTGAAAARDWLNSLKNAVAGDQVVALPFGDVDLASLAHQGRKVPGVLSHLRTAATLGANTVETILGVTPASDVAWPVNGAIDPSIVSAARTGGAHRIIARGDTFPDSLDYSPSAARPIGGGTTAVVADATMSTAFHGQMLYAQSANLAIQNFLAQTLMITMQAPAKQRTILVAPDRMPDVPQAQAMAAAISAVDDVPWAAAVSFDDVAKARPDADANRRVPRAYPGSLRRSELPEYAFRQLQRTQRSLNSFVVILTRKDRVTVPFGNSMLRAMSTQWRGDGSGAAYFRLSVDDYLHDLMDAVHILNKSELTLSGRSGTIPVTVKNELNQAITGLQLRLTSGTTIRLEISGPQQPITIDGGHTRTLKFQTSARGNGRTHITAALYTGRNTRYNGQDGTIGFEVKITNVTDLVMLVIAAGLLLLVLAGVRIYRQRKRRAAADGGHGGHGGHGAAMDGIDPGQPGDPAADTGQESPEPSPADEKVDG